MDAKDFNEETRTEDSGSDVEEFISIIDRMKAMKKLPREGISGEQIEEGEKKIIGGSKCGWMPSFEWEDFCDRDRRPDSVTVKNANGDGGVRIQEQTRGIKGEVRGSVDGPSKRLRDAVESAPNFPSELRLGKWHSSEIKADISDVRATSFDLNTDDQEEAKLAFTVGLPPPS